MLTQLRSVLSQGTEYLGDLVWWALADARIDRVTLEKHWLDSGLAPELLPEPPTAEKAVRAAVREGQLGHADRLVRLGKENESELIFAVVRETKHADGSVSFAQEARIVLDRRSETLSDDAPEDEVVKTVRAAFNRLRHEHTADDIRRAMLRVLNNAAAVTLREHGGIYWVPAPHADHLRRLQQAVEQIGTSKLYLLPVHRSADSEMTLGSVARGAVEEELVALKAELQEFISCPPERSATLVRRLDAFDNLRSRATLYRDLLHVEVSDLDKQIGTLAETVENILQRRAA